MGLLALWHGEGNWGGLWVCGTGWVFAWVCSWIGVDEMGFGLVRAFFLLCGIVCIIYELCQNFTALDMIIITLFIPFAL